MFEKILNKYSNTGSLEGKMASAMVVDNNDPEQLQRVKCRVSELHSGRTPDELVWAIQFTLSPQGHSASVGSIAIPLIGSKVVLFFPEDDEHDIYYVADLNDKSTQIAELLVDYPNVYGNIDASGNLFLVNTLRNTVTYVQVTGSSITLSANGDVNIVAAKDLNFKAMGNINLDAVNVNLQKGYAAGLTATARNRPTANPTPSNDY